MSEEAQVVAPEATPDPVAAEPTQVIEQADESGASETVAESDESKAERLVKEKQIRQQRAQRKLDQRFAEMTEQRKSAERQVEQLTGILKQFVSPDKAAAPDQAPKREQFDDYETYVEAKAAHIAEKRAEAKFQALIEQQQKQGQQQNHQQIATQLEQNWTRNASEFAKATPDFNEVVNNDDVVIPDESVAMIRAMPEGPQIAYALGKDPKLAEQLMRFAGNPVMQAMYLGQYSATLKSSPQVSKAPAAGKPVGARPAPANEPPKDVDAYMAWRKKNMR